MIFSVDSLHMNNHLYKSLGLLIACFYWLIDSLIHKFLYREEHFEFIPSEFNELWMRTAIFFLVILLGGYADFHTKKILLKEEEKIRIFRSTVRATHHILNNFLNKMQLFLLEAESSSDFDKSKLALFNQAIQDTAEQIKEMESITDISEENIEDTVYPK